jgi:hypothetical protein
MMAAALAGAHQHRGEHAQQHRDVLGRVVCSSDQLLPSELSAQPAGRPRTAIPRNIAATIST